MRKVKTDNSDLIEYVNTVKELKNHGNGANLLI